MKAKTAAVVVILAALGVGVILLALSLRRAQQAAHLERSTLVTQVTILSNDLQKTQHQWVEQTKVNSLLEGEAAKKGADLITVSNRLSYLSNLLAKAESEAREAAEAAALAATTAAAAADEELKKRDTRIAQLQGEKDRMTEKLNELNQLIGKLEGQIGETERKLTSAEGDREFLLGELKRLQGEKAGLERQFHDLAVLREQVRKLRDELSMARRIEWIRKGLSSSATKGGELLNRPLRPQTTRTNYDLNVEVRTDGTSKVLPPGAAAPPPAPK